MASRDELIDIVTRDADSAGGDRTWASDLVDAYSAALLRQAARHLRTVNPDRSADFSDGVDWAITQLNELADGN
ncbi:hypothetical protein ACF1BE_18770 [Streptomyces sp. NPDC014991]|uniref:hypothetical protein n=1 Tax=Streptomyces sp. NPDC014991 TaxID=3364935 RepID=UPI0037027E04